MPNVSKNGLKFCWLSYRYYIIVVFCSIITLICGISTIILLKIYDLGIILIVFGFVQMFSGLSLIIIKYCKLRKTNLSDNMCANPSQDQNETTINCEIIAHQNSVFALWKSIKISFIRMIMGFVWRKLDTDLWNFKL